MSLTDFVKEQTSLNNIAEILKALYDDDVVVATKEDFNNFVELTYDLLIATEESIDKLIKDSKLVDTITKLSGDTVKESIDDIIYMTLHATIAKQTMVIKKLILENERCRK